MERIYRKQSAKIVSRMAIRFIAVVIAISAIAAMLTACSANNDAQTSESAAIAASTATEPLEEVLWINNVLKPDDDVSGHTYNLILNSN